MLMTIEKTFMAMPMTAMGMSEPYSEVAPYLARVELQT